MYTSKFKRIGFQNVVSNGFGRATVLYCGPFIFNGIVCMEKILDHPEFGTIILIKEFLSKSYCNRILDELTSYQWSEHKIVMFGKLVKEPRDIAFFGDPNVSYNYSGFNMVAKPWNSSLLNLRDLIQDFTQDQFNSVLVNHYPDGDSYVGWHCDDEPELGLNPHIASVSFGHNRDFIFRFKADKSKKIKVHLEAGDLLIMGDHIQRFWEHSLPKRKKVVSSRVNLTFRFIR